MKKILVLDNIKKEGLAILKKDFELDFKGKLKEEELLEIVENYDAVLVRSGTKITKNVLVKAKNLKLVGRAGVGVDNIDIESATRNGVLVMNVPAGNTISACEHTFALILSLLRNIPQAHSSMKQGKWDRKKFTGNELYSKTLGIIGLGRIGREVAKRALSFGVRVVGYDPYISKEYVQKLGVELLSFEEVMKNSDIITLHVALNENTKYLINKQTLSLMKDDSFLINVSRGPVINEKDLYEFLKEKKIKGAALDVFEKEPPEDLIFRNLDNVILTPHLGATTVEAQERVSVELAKQVYDYFKEGKILNAVNFPVKEFKEEMKNLMLLAEKLGSAFVQLEKNFEEIEILYSKDLLDIDRNLIASSFFKGFLSKIIDEKVSIVNSLMYVKERNITWKEDIIKDTEYKNLIGVRGKNFTISGIAWERSYRFIKINEYPVSILPEGIIILFSNIDKPGVIGKVGTILGEEKINIARMEVGRKEEGGEAITCVKVDSLPEDSVIKKLEDFDFVKWVKKIEL